MTIISIYDLSLSLRVGWEGHSLSNVGSNGTNRLLGRKILLADGVEADSASGNILKHHHARLTREYLQSRGVPLCSACAVGDGRRAAGLPAAEQRAGHPMARCGLCDIHGYLVVARGSAGEIEDGKLADASAAEPTGKRTRQPKAPIEKAASESQTRQARPSLIEFSFAIGVPAHQAETRQLFTRIGDGQNGAQMLMTMPNRSGVYALNVRYRAVGIGTDTYSWQTIVDDRSQRLARHQATLAALRDQILSPGGARTSSMLPHVSSLMGAICIRHSVGRAPVYSGLDPRFIERLQALKIGDMTVHAFDGIEGFAETMDTFIASSVPAEIPAGHET